MLVCHQRGVNSLYEFWCGIDFFWTLLQQGNRRLVKGCARMCEAVRYCKEGMLRYGGGEEVSYSEPVLDTVVV